MKEYRIIDEFGAEASGKVEYLVNRAAREGFRPISIAMGEGGMLAVLMEREIKNENPHTTPTA